MPTKRKSVLNDDPELWCRAMGHNWRPTNKVPKKPPMFGVRHSVECSNCKTVRHDIINTWGRVGQRHYVYPEAYTEIRAEIEAEHDAVGTLPGNTSAAAAKRLLLGLTPESDDPFQKDG